MSKTNSHTAILLFTRTAAEEALNKQFFPGLNFDKNEALGKALIGYTHQQAIHTGLPTFLFGSALQTGNNFGERFTHAIASVFAKGFEKVIAIGNDCLELTTEDLLLAVEQLSKKDWVLGPATDGGVYLLGLDHKHFDRERLLKISWETDQVFEELFALTNGNNCECLPVKTDLDSWADLNRILANLSDVHWVKILINSLLGRFHSPKHYSSLLLPHKIWLFIHPLRGPPQYTGYRN